MRQKTPMDESEIYEGPVPGEVVDRKDPTESLQIRVRVKSIYGEINKDALPWAPPLSGASAEIGGPPAGETPHEFGSCHVPYEGSWVATYFVQGDHMKPVYGGAMPPEKSVPKRFRGEEDEIFQTIQDNLVDGDIKELETKLPSYPDVHGTLYSSGILFEVDEKDGGERLLWFHPSGWRNEVLPNGDHVIHVENNQQVIVMQNREMHVGKNLSEVIKGNSETKVEGNRKQTVQGNKEETIEGDKKETVQGEKEKTVEGNNIITVGGNRTEEVSGNQESTISGNQTIQVTGNRTIKTVGTASEQVSASKTLQTGGAVTIKAGGPITLQGPLIKLSGPVSMG